MSWDDNMRDLAGACLDAFADAEAVVYRPQGGEARPVEAIVDRSPPTRLFAALGVTVKARAVTVDLRNSATAGVVPAALQESVDKLDVAAVKGGTPKPRNIEKVLRHDAGRVLVLVYC